MALYPHNPVDISIPMKALLDELGIDPTYVYRLDITPREVTVFCFRGADGWCRGNKYVEMEREPFVGEVAVEPPLTIKVIT